MAEKKGQHIFAEGDMVLPHPVISIVWKDAEENDHGIVIKTIKPTSPKDERRVIIYWQQSQKTICYSNKIVYHLHHFYQVEELNELWEKRGIKAIVKNGGTLFSLLATGLFDKPDGLIRNPYANTKW